MLCSEITIDEILVISELNNTNIMHTIEASNYNYDEKNIVICLRSIYIK